MLQRVKTQVGDINGLFCAILFTPFHSEIYIIHMSILNLFQPFSETANDFIKPVKKKIEKSAKSNKKRIQKETEHTIGNISIIVYIGS